MPGREADFQAALRTVTYQNTSVCFFGHTHVPVAFIRDAVVRGGTYSKFKVEPGRKYFVNVGSVGQPRDNNPKAAYVIYDLDHAKNIAILRAWLREHGIWNVGRFGEWQYFNMDHSMRSGKTAAEEILKSRGPVPS